MKRSRTLRVTSWVSQMSEIKIDKGIEMPGEYSARTKYPWRALEVGDSFFVPNRSPAGMTTPVAVQREGRKFAFRTWSNGTKQGVRVWRVE